MPVNVFIQDHSGEHNGECTFDDLDYAKGFVEDIRKSGGYWSDLVFVPWHRIDFIELTEV